MRNEEQSRTFSGSDTETPAGDPNQSIDVEYLAERVYRLMESELRLDRARGATNAVFKGE
jgi:hypothetical protein